MSLDLKETYARFDPENLRQHWENFPSELLRADKQTADWNPDLNWEKIDAVIICGMGGSGIAGLITQSLGIKNFKLPITVVQGYNLPDWVNQKTLVLAVSYSGDTEETLNCVEIAQAKKAQIITITKGGKLALLAEKNHWPNFKIDYQAPPRAALAHLLVPILFILSQIQKDFVYDWEKIAASLEKINTNYLIEKPTAKNPAKQLAEFCFNKKITLIAGEHLTTSAIRFKNQLNENAKHWAAYEVLPELSHNFTASLSFPVDTRLSTGIIILSSRQYHPRMLPRLDWLRQYLKTSGWSYYEIEASTSHSDVSDELLETIILGDWTSYYLAMLNQIAPAPVPTIMASKEYLSTCH